LLPDPRLNIGEKLTGRLLPDPRLNIGEKARAATRAEEELHK
jgi:hypothetical protein